MAALSKLAASGVSAIVRSGTRVKRSEWAGVTTCSSSSRHKTRSENHRVNMYCVGE